MRKKCTTICKVFLYKTSKNHPQLHHKGTLVMTKPALFISLVAVFITMQLSISSVFAGSMSTSTKGILKSQQRFAEKGNVYAQYKLGSMYEFGIGTEINLEKAGDWYTQASSSGSVSAENRLVYLKLRKNGFDKKNHADWLNKVKKDAGTGDQQATILLGQMYSYGIGVKKDLDKSIRLLNKAGILQNPFVSYEIERVEKEKTRLARPERQLQEEAKKSSQPNLEAVNKARVMAKKKAYENAEKRHRYERAMRKIRDEERIIEEQQAWAEGKEAKQ